jgi:hypothetical protein
MTTAIERVFPRVKGYVHPVEVVAFVFACIIVAGLLAFVAQLGRAAKRPSAEQRLRPLQPQSLSEEAEEWLRRQA